MTFGECLKLPKTTLTRKHHNHSSKNEDRQNCLNYLINMRSAELSSRYESHLSLIHQNQPQPDTINLFDWPVPSSKKKEKTSTEKGYHKRKDKLSGITTNHVNLCSIYPCSWGGLRWPTLKNRTPRIMVGSTRLLFKESSDVFEVH